MHSIANLAYESSIRFSYLHNVRVVALHFATGACRSRGVGCDASPFSQKLMVTLWLVGKRWHKDLGLSVICGEGESSKPRDISRQLRKFCCIQFSY